MSQPHDADADRESACAARMLRVVDSINRLSELALWAMSPVMVALVLALIAVTCMLLSLSPPLLTHVG